MNQLTEGDAIKMYRNGVVDADLWNAAYRTGNNELASAIADRSFFKKANDLLYPKTVLAHGCFDLLHLGHIRHLEEAKRQGDRLVVSVTADPHVNKGVGRPHFTAAERVEALKALACVDEVVVSDSPDAVDVISRLKPAVYVKGDDYGASLNGALSREIDAVQAHGGRLHITQSAKWSSSRLINAEKFSDEMLDYLDHARAAGYADLIEAAWGRADKLKIAFVGETIIDEYRYVQALGRASKEFMLATVETGVEIFSGGILAAARHGEWENVRVVSPAKTIRKTRFVDADFNRKLFDVYSAKKLDLSDHARAAFHEDLRQAVAESDVVIVNDFGHGLMGGAARGLVMGSKFLAVNAQTNAGNWGFNPVTNYPRADFVCVDDPEARLAAGMEEAPIGAVIDGLARQIECERFLVTHGRHGSVWRYPDDAGTAPAFARAGIDTMGAGDAVMAVTAPLIAAGLDLGPAALVGNVVGAIKVSILGHRRPVGRAEAQETVRSLLK